MAEVYNKMPSEILFIEDPYVAFCFNEACYYIRNKIKVDGEEPVFIVKVNSFKELYARYE